MLVSKLRRPVNRRFGAIRRLRGRPWLYEDNREEARNIVDEIDRLGVSLAGAAPVALGRDLSIQLCVEQLTNARFKGPEVLHAS